MSDLNFDFGKTLLLGVCMDVSQSFIEKGFRTIEVVKNALIQKICSEQDFMVYMSLLENNLPNTTGISTHQIKTFKEPLDYNISKVLLRCVQMVGQHEDSHKHILLITNHGALKDVAKYKTALRQNENKGHDCLFHVLGIGMVEDYSHLEVLAKEHNAVFTKITTVEQLNEYIKRIGVKNG